MNETQANQHHKTRTVIEMGSRIRVALLAGGTSDEREVSIKSGDQVEAALDKERYQVLRFDPATDLPRLISLAQAIDVALVILHGPGGEDGTVQGLLDLLSIPYQCSGVLGSALAMNKIASKRQYISAGIPVPDHLEIPGPEGLDPAFIIDRLGLPVVIKPASGGSSIGMSIVETAVELDAGIKRAFEHDTRVIAEAYLRGIEITGAVMGNDILEALPLVEIAPKGNHRFFDFEAKYTPGHTDEICPARLDPGTESRAKALAIEAHKALFCETYSRTDMIVTDAGVYVLETNTIPGMTETSLYPQAARAAGIDYPCLMDRLIELALEKRKPGKNFNKKKISRESRT